MVYRVYVEKRDGYKREAEDLLNELTELLGVSRISELRIINRYDVEGISEDVFSDCVNTVFSEPPVDMTCFDFPASDDETAFAVEYLPGQFDQRADSAAECIQLITRGERPNVRSAKLYVMNGDIDDEDLATLKKYIINPVEAREASLDKPETLELIYEPPVDVAIIDGFRKWTYGELEAFMYSQGLAMDIADLQLCQSYFTEEGRDPSITEIKVIDTYWSDHCRHTTFNTVIKKFDIDDPAIEATYRDYISVREELNVTKPVSLMNIGTIAAKYLKSKGLLDRLDESEEINACTVKINVDVDGQPEKWLLLFKNETHNHPTEIEPFGGAATCIGGAIRDPLSGRCYVYSAMRLTGAADPLTPVSETLEGKLPQRKIVTTAAHGYSSYGNQIGLATGQVDEIYHPGYVAKRMEVGAVIGAAPQENVIRMRPTPGDSVILLGGKTGRDGCGGATGSSKSHTTESLEECGAEVQKGNAPEERKLQRLFRNPVASKMIKRCNDFGAGGVSVAIGELADGLDINLDAVPKKYEGLDGTELAISESQERMAVVVSSDDTDSFVQLALEENLSATKVAVVCERPYLTERWRGKTIVDLSRTFLDTNGAEKKAAVVIPKHKDFKKVVGKDFKTEYEKLAGDLNVCSKRGLSEMFDSTIGAGTLLMPFGGKYQKTPAQAMANLISIEKGDTDDCSVMSWGFNPFISEKSPYHGAYLAVLESICKLVATGASYSNDIYLSFQEYFEKLGNDPKRWGKPAASVLGAFRAQLDYSIASIGGKDSMSGTFEDIDVPPTLISFAVTTTKANEIISPEFKSIDSKIFLLTPKCDKYGLPEPDSVKNIYYLIERLSDEKILKSSYACGYGGIAEAVLKMCIGNGFGFAFSDELTFDEIFNYNYGAFIIECSKDANDFIESFLESNSFPADCKVLGTLTEFNEISYGDSHIIMEELTEAYEDKLEPVFKCNIKQSDKTVENISFSTNVNVRLSAGISAPGVLIPVFPGTNCEYDAAKAFTAAGAKPDIYVINTLTPGDIARSVDAFAEKILGNQMIFIPGGFSGGDEPDGSGKFITAFFRNQAIREAIDDIMYNRDGLIAGICNGFQALIKLGLIPYGKITDQTEDSPTLTFNLIGRHQSKLVNTRIASNKSPWLRATNVGDVYKTPISHGEGRLIATPEELNSLAKNGQIAAQYADPDGNATMDIQYNPNGSDLAIEAMTSPDGRILGKMGHTERTGRNLYKNVPGNYDMKMFESAVKYFK